MEKNELKLNVSKETRLAIILISVLLLIGVFSIIYYFGFYDTIPNDYENAQMPDKKKLADPKNAIANPINPDDLVDMDELTNDLKNKLTPDNVSNNKLFSE